MSAKTKTALALGTIIAQFLIFSLIVPGGFVIDFADFIPGNTFCIELPFNLMEVFFYSLFKVPAVFYNLFVRNASITEP